MKNIFVFLILLLGLSSCNDYITKDQHRTRIGGHFIVASDGELQKLTPSESDDLINKTRAVKGPITGFPAKVKLSFNGDNVQLKKGELFNFEVNIDESVSTIESKYDKEDETLTLTVIPINKTRKVVLNDICDMVYIPNGNVPIEVKDNYNSKQSESKSKSYSKIVIVPTFDEKCNVNGHYVRFDTANRPKNCPDKKIVTETDKNIKDCNDKSTPKPLCPPPKHTNCAEYRLFRICCP